MATVPRRCRSPSWHCNVRQQIRHEQSPHPPSWRCGLCCVKNRRKSGFFAHVFFKVASSFSGDEPIKAQGTYTSGRVAHVFVADASNAAAPHSSVKGPEHKIREVEYTFAEVIYNFGKVIYIFSEVIHTFWAEAKSIVITIRYKPKSCINFCLS
jgi:hypothetical protein